MENTAGTNNIKKANRGFISALVVLGLIALLGLVAAFAVTYSMFREKPEATEGAKSVTIEVVNKAQKTTRYEVNTDAGYLRQAMEEAGAKGLTFSGTESQYGMMVDTVNGEKTDYNVDGSYWAFYVNGEYCNYGIDTQPVDNGDVFSIRYTASAP